MADKPKYRLVTRSDFDGLVCAMILKEKGLFKDELAALAKRYSYKEAMAGKTNCAKLKEETLKLVNQ